MADPLADRPGELLVADPRRELGEIGRPDGGEGLSVEHQPALRGARPWQLAQPRIRACRPASASCAALGGASRSGAASWVRLSTRLEANHTQAAKRSASTRIPATT